MLHREKSHTGLVILRGYTSKCKQAEYIELARARRGQERCLKCSSHAVIPYKLVKEGGGFKEKGDFMYHGEHKTDFEHPGCGGMFCEKADDVRLHCMFEPRFIRPTRCLLSLRVNNRINSMCIEPNLALRHGTLG